MDKGSILRNMDSSKVVSVRTWYGYPRIAVLGIWFVLILSACSSPTIRFDDLAEELGYRRQEIAGKEFHHIAYFNNQTGREGLLHVYLGSDGTPWIHQSIAADPTPRNPVMLRLMRRDPTPSVYLGRPCYHGLAHTPSCSPQVWTHARFSQQVVESMAQALKNIIRENHYTRIALLGYSGGGTLAMLLANQLPESRAIVTLAGNLDVVQWARYHQYAKLEHSMNPANLLPLIPRIQQLHYVGENDRNVPSWLIQPVVAKQAGAQLIRLNGFDHRCCWEEVWPTILDTLESRLGSAMQ